MSGCKTKNQDWNCLWRFWISVEECWILYFLVIININKTNTIFWYYLINTFLGFLCISLFLQSTLKYSCNYSHIIGRETEDQRGSNFSKNHWRAQVRAIVCWFVGVRWQAVQLEGLEACEHENVRRCHSRLRERLKRRYGNRKWLGRLRFWRGQQPDKKP